MVEEVVELNLALIHPFLHMVLVVLVVVDKVMPSRVLVVEDNQVQQAQLTLEVVEELVMIPIQVEQVDQE